MNWTLLSQVICTLAPVYVSMTHERKREYFPAAFWFLVAILQAAYYAAPLLSAIAQAVR